MEMQGTAGDLCVDLPDGDDTNGNELRLAPCIGGNSQHFFFFSKGTLVHGPSSKCIDGGDLADNSPLLLWDCNDGDQQMISYDQDAGGIYSGADNSRCVEAEGAFAGARLRWWTCDGRGSQIWTFDSAQFTLYANSDVVMAASIYSQETGKCWDVPDSNAGDGQVVQLGDCVGSSNQGWVWQDSTITSGLELRQCLDMPGGDSTDGRWLALWQCNGSPQQEWALDDSTGRIFQLGSTKCIDVDPWYGDAEHGHLMVYECNGADSQSFAIASGGDMRGLTV